MRKYIPLLLLITCFCLGKYVQAQVIPAIEFNCLKTLYNSFTNPDKATLLLNWDISRTDNRVENWEGITVENGFVTHINLSGKGLKADFSLSENKNALIYFSKLRYLNLSNNLFIGTFPILYIGAQPNLYSFTDLEYFNISNNSFHGVLRIPEVCLKLKELYADNNKLEAFSLYSPLIEKVSFRNNMLYGGTFYPIYIPDSVQLHLDTLDLRGNKQDFASLWRFSDPNPPFTPFINQQNRLDTLWLKNIYFENTVTFLCQPQDSIWMGRMVNGKKVRSSVGGAFRVDIPDVGQKNQTFPEIRDQLAFQWFKNGIALPNDTAAFISRESVSENDFGSYYCQIKSKTVRLKELTLCTESFMVVNEINLPPVIAITEGNQAQRFKKGGFSSPVKLEISDDMPLLSEAATGKVTFEITQLPKHMEFLGNILSIQVRDTSALWVGKDSLEITLCDYEGACTSLWLYFTVFDELYAPPILAEGMVISFDKKINIQWNTDFYNSKGEKPEGYFFCVNSNANVMGAGMYVPEDTVVLNGMTTNSVTLNIPEKDAEFLLQLQLFAENGNGVSSSPSFVHMPMPVIPDSNLVAVFDPKGVALHWKLTSSSAFMLTNHNAIYRSMDGGEFVLIYSLTGFNQNSFMDSTTEKGHTYQYKLIKKAAAFTVPPLNFEIPYLQSNTTTITIHSDIERGELIAPPLKNIQIDDKKNINFQWDIHFYSTQTEKPEGYYVLLKINTDLTSTDLFEVLDSFSIALKEIDSIKLSLTNHIVDNHIIRLELYAYNSNQNSILPTTLNFPLPAIPDSLLEARYDSNKVELKWQLSKNIQKTDYNVVYRSENGNNFIPIFNCTQLNQTSYIDSTVTAGNTYHYKLVKKTISLESPFIEIELPYIVSNHVEITIPVFADEKLTSPPLTLAVIDTNKKITLYWDSTFYDDNHTRPEYYFLLSKINFGHHNTGVYSLIDSISQSDIHANYISMSIPQSNSDYNLCLEFYVKNSKSISSTPTSLYIPIPARPDSNLQAVIISNNVKLHWDPIYTNPFLSNNYNAIYRSIDGSNFILLNNNTDQNSFIDSTVQTGHTYQYKLIKKTLSINVPDFELEIPYLESNITEIKIVSPIITTDTLHSPPIISLAVNSDKEILLNWNIDFYNEKNEKPNGYFLIIQSNTDPKGNGNSFHLDSIPIDNQIIDIINTPLPDHNNEYQLKVHLYAYNNMGNSLIPSSVIIPMPVKPDTNLHAINDSTGVLLNWELTGHSELTSHNVIYRSINGDIFHPLYDFTDVNQTSYVDSSVIPGNTYQYKLVKKTNTISEPTMGIELSYLESNTTEIKTTTTTDVKITLINPSENHIKIHPNPSTDYLIIENNNQKIYSIDIIDMKGNIVLRNQLMGVETKTIELNISILPTGIYLCKINTNQGVQMHKIIKK